jgi:hypothetical protein
MGKLFNLINEEITNDWYIKVTWSGGFEYDGQEYDVTYQNIYIDVNGNVFGDGSDFVGEFIISGTWDKHGTVRFIKQYSGRHTVYYTGVSDDDQNVCGRWKISGDSEGGFWLSVEGFVKLLGDLKR